MAQLRHLPWELDLRHQGASQAGKNRTKPLPGGMRPGSWGWWSRVGSGVWQNSLGWPRPVEGLRSEGAQPTQGGPRFRGTLLRR